MVQLDHHINMDIKVLYLTICIGSNTYNGYQMDVYPNTNYSNINTSSNSNRGQIAMG